MDSYLKNLANPLLRVFSLAILITMLNASNICAKPYFSDSNSNAKVKPTKFGKISSTPCAGTHYVVPSSTNLSSIISFLPSSGPIKLDITGILTIDVNINFPAGSDIIFNDLAGMDVLSGVLMNSNGTAYRGCNALWRSINIKTGGSASFYNCTISDGLHALDYENQSKLSIANCTFNNNFVGVRCNNQTSGVGIISWADDTYTFINNKFNGGALLAYSGSDTDWFLSPGSTYAGLELNRIGHFPLSVVIPTGIPYMFNNEFRNAKFGILSNESSITVEKTSFGRNYVGIQEVAQTPGKFVKIDGGASQLVDFRTHTYAAVNISGFDKTVQPINFNSFDVPLSGSDLNMQKAKLSSSIIPTFQGVRLYGLQQKQIFVQYNDFDYCYHGIRTSGNGLLNQYQIKNNIYNYSVMMQEMAEKTFFSMVPNSIVGNPGTVQCNNNTITSVKNFYGIEIHSVNNAEIKNNTIFNTTNDPQDVFRGVFLGGNCSNYDVESNNVTGPGQNNPNTTNYALNNSTGLSFCNYSSNAYIGIQKFGDCFPSNVYSNHINNQTIGYYMDYGSIVGLQDNHQNQWHNNPYSSDGAFFGPINFPNYHSFSQFNIATSVPVQMDPLWPKPVSVGIASANNGVGSWFVPFGTQNPSCSQGGEFQEPGSPYTYVTDQDKGIANGDYENEPDETKWTLYWGLYEKLNRTPALIATDAVYSNFMQNMSNTNIAKIYEVYDGLHSLGDLAGILAYRTHHEALVSQSIVVTDRLKEYAEAANSQAKTAIWSQLQTDEVALQNLEDNSSAISDDRNNALQNQADALNTVLAGLTNANVIEQNFVDIYSIVLAHLGDIDANFSSGELATIVDIAEQCPYYGGRAVIEARGLVTLAGVQASYHDDNCFIETRESKTKSYSNTHEVVSMTYANPVSDKMSYFIKGSKAKNIDLAIMNTNGQIVLVEQGLSTQGVLNTETLSSGMYILECKVGDERLVEKLIIQK